MSARMGAPAPPVSPAGGASSRLERTCSAVTPTASRSVETVEPDGGDSVRYGFTPGAGNVVGGLLPPASPLPATGGFGRNPITRTKRLRRTAPKRMRRTAPTRP